MVSVILILVLKIGFDIHPLLVTPGFNELDDLLCLGVEDVPDKYFDNRVNMLL